MGIGRLNSLFSHDNLFYCTYIMKQGLDLRQKLNFLQCCLPVDFITADRYTKD